VHVLHSERKNKTKEFNFNLPVPISTSIDLPELLEIEDSSENPLSLGKACVGQKNEHIPQQCFEISKALTPTLPPDEFFCLNTKLADSVLQQMILVCAPKSKMRR
jgi:hypothetical protein